jgi:hypothetical protein
MSVQKKDGARAPSNAINHPSHYQGVPGVECIDVARYFNFNLGNVIKYVWRAGRKEGSSLLEDLKKARWYLDDEIRQLEERAEKAGAEARAGR